MHTTILVTGATGTVGREVIKQLSMYDGDIRVRAGVHSVIKGENLKRLPDVEIVEIDFKDKDSLHAAFTHVDKLFLITPMAEDQIEMAKTLVDEAKKAGIKHIVKLSAMGADMEPGIQLCRLHREIEKYIEDSGIRYTFLRPASFMQNFVNYSADEIKRDGKIYQPTGDGRIGYVDARDVAAVGIEALTNEGHEGKIYELTGPEAISNSEVAEILSEVTGKKIDFVNVTDEEARKDMANQEMPEWMIDAMMELYGVYRSGNANQVFDSVQAVINRKPHTFKQFAEDYKECF
jgi:uncharacterized protein YbjT (DUF2867 family)